MAWIESHQEIMRHPKTRRLARALECSIPAAIGHLHCLWWWAMDYAQDGNIGTYDYEEIADAALWDGDPHLFWQALVTSGYVDLITEDGPPAHVLHDWHDYAGRLIEQRHQAKERTRAWRDRHKPSPPIVTNAHVTHNEHITYGTSHARLTEPNSTVPNNTLEVESAGKERVQEPTPDKPARTRTYPEHFERTWADYPAGHKQDKPGTFKVYQAVKPDAEVQQAMTDGLQQWLLCQRWQEGVIVDMKRWVKERRWEAPPPAATTMNGARASPNGRPSNEDTTRQAIQSFMERHRGENDLPSTNGSLAVDALAQSTEGRRREGGDPGVIPARVIRSV